MAYQGEITQQHLDIASWVARGVSRTNLGRIEGFDELYSEALFQIQVIADNFDPSRTNSPFEVHLGHVLKLRLTDYLRKVYGRYKPGKTQQPARMMAMTSSFSIDANSARTQEGDDNELSLNIAGSGDVVEEGACSHEEFARVMEAISELHPTLQCLAVHQISGYSYKEIAKLWGCNTGNISYRRMQIIVYLRKVALGEEDAEFPNVGVDESAVVPDRSRRDLYYLRKNAGLQVNDCEVPGEQSFLQGCRCEGCGSWYLDILDQVEQIRLIQSEHSEPNPNIEDEQEQQEEEEESTDARPYVPTVTPLFAISTLEPPPMLTAEDEAFLRRAAERARFRREREYRREAVSA